MAMLNMRYVFPDRLVDLNRVTELDYILPGDRGVRIGAMTRQRALERSDVIKRELPLIRKALRHVGHFQTRNRGTIGGSLCQLDPSAELPALATALDAIVEAVGPNGGRTIPFHEFPQMFMTSSLAPDEILTAINLKPWAGRTGTGFHEFSRRHGDFAIGGAIALLQTDAAGRIVRASLTVFGVAERPKRVSDAEAMLVGQRPDAALIDAASNLCIAQATLNDVYATADYRGHVAAAMARTALAEACTELGIEVVLQ